MQELGENAAARGGFRNPWQGTTRPSMCPDMCRGARQGAAGHLKQAGPSDTWLDASRGSQGCGAFPASGQT